MIKKALGLLSIGLLVGSAMPALATTVSFTDEADFVAQTGSTLLTLPDMNTNIFVTIPGQLTITAPNIIGTSGQQIISGSHLVALRFNLAPNFVGRGGGENWDITALTTIHSFGFSLYEPTSAAPLNGCNAACIESTFVISLFSGSTELYSLTVEPPNDAFNFYGFQSSDAITAVRIRETVGSAENEFFGRFYVGAAPLATAVPEPSALALIVLGLAMMGLNRRRKAKATPLAPRSASESPKGGAR